MENKPVKIWWARMWLGFENMNGFMVLVEPAPSRELMLDQIEATTPDFYTECFDAINKETADKIGNEKIKEEYEKWLNKKTPTTPSV